MKCSVLICSRARPNLLKRTIESVWQHSKREDVEILIRCDDDDETLDPIKAIWAQDPLVTFFTGPRKLGYSSVSDFYSELNDHANAPWCLYLNDDMTIKDDLGDKSWPDRLMEMPANALVQAQWHHINQSIYEDQRQTGAPIAARHAWRQIGQPILEHPFDAILRRWWEERGLPILNLKDFRTIHNWLAPDSSAA